MRMYNEFFEVWENEGIFEATGVVEKNIKDQEVVELIKGIVDKYDQLDTEMFTLALKFTDEKNKNKALEKAYKELAAEYNKVVEELSFIKDEYLF